MELGIADGVLGEPTLIEEIEFDHPGAVVAVVEIGPELIDCVVRELQLETVLFDDSEVP